MDIFDSVILLYFYEYLLSVKRKNVIFDAKLGIRLLHSCIFSSTHLRDLLSMFNSKSGESSHWLSTLLFTREICDGAKVHPLRSFLCVVLEMRKSLEVFQKDSF